MGLYVRLDMILRGLVLVYKFWYAPNYDMIKQFSNLSECGADRRWHDLYVESVAKFVFKNR